MMRHPAACCHPRTLQTHSLPAGTPRRPACKVQMSDYAGVCKRNRKTKQRRSRLFDCRVWNMPAWAAHIGAPLPIGEDETFGGWVVAGYTRTRTHTLSNPSPSKALSYLLEGLDHLSSRFECESCLSMASKSDRVALAVGYAVCFEDIFHHNPTTRHYTSLSY